MCFITSIDGWMVTPKCESAGYNYDEVCKYKTVNACNENTVIELLNCKVESHTRTFCVTG